MTKQTKRRNAKSKPNRAKTITTKSDIKSLVSQMAKAAIKSQTNNYQDRSSVLGNIGMMAGNGISKIFGLGAYTMDQNSLFNQKTASQVPFMHSSDESVVFRHREYIGEISSSVAFSATTFNVNPGLSETFPYLASIASAFQEYRFRGLIFEFKSTGATALVSGTNTAMGAVMLAAQYRADAIPFTNKVELLNEMWSTDCKTSDNCILPIECSPKENPMSIQYIRAGAPTGDIKLYDLCNVTVATQGSQAANIVGELWVSYEVEFFKPAVTPTGGILRAAHYHATGTAAGISPFGISPSVVYDSLGLKLSTVVGGPSPLTFAPFTTGNFTIQLIYFGGAVAFAPGAINLPANVTVLNVYNGTSHPLFPSAGTVSTDCSSVFSFTIAPVSATTVITFANGIQPTNGVVEIIVTEIDDNFF